MNGTYSLEWAIATPTARVLAESLDDLADTRLWFDVGVLNGLWDVLGMRQHYRSAGRRRSPRRLAHGRRMEPLTVTPRASTSTG